jgi:hypothetical protein
MAKKNDTKPVAAGNKRVRVVTETVEEHDEGGESGGELEISDATGAPRDEDADALQELYELDGGSGARFEVRRTSPAEFVGYVGTYSRDAFSLDTLQEQWGGGNFTIRVRGTGGNYVGSKTITLAGKAKHKAESVVNAQAAPVASGDGGQLAGVLSAIQKNNEAQMTMVMSLLTAVLSKPAPVAPPAPDPLAMIAALKGIMKPENSEGGAVKLLLQGIELGKGLGEAGGETNMMDLVAKGFDTIKEAASLAPAPVPAPVRAPVQRLAAPVPNHPAPGMVPATEPAGEPPMTDQMKQIQWLRQQAGMLVKLAEKKKDPELYAEVFLDNLPPFVPAQLVYDTMSKPGAVAQLAMLNAAVGTHAEWFESFRAAVIDLLEGDEEDEPGAEESGEGQLDVGTSAPAGEPEAVPYEENI